MDHLHLQLKIEPLHIEVPCLCTELYTPKGEWIDYPEENGIRLDDLRGKKYMQYTPKIMMPFLQNWLFFGIIWEVLPFELKLEDFVLNKENLSVVTTQKLPQYLERWKEESKSWSTEHVFQIWKKNVEILEVASSFISSLSAWPEHNSSKLVPFNPITREISLSMAFLGRALHIVNNETIIDPERVLSSQITYGGSLLLEHMEAQGWCPFLVAEFG